MPMLRISVTENGAGLHEAAAPLGSALRHGLRADPGPVTLMIHGYKYQPGHMQHCPHASILARRPGIVDRRTVSWPRHLGLRGQRGEGLGLSFGWQARGSIWAAHAEAARAGDELARLLTDIRRLAPDRSVNVVAHSLGARVALRGIAGAESGAVSRVILLAAAEYAGTALDALQGSGPRTEVLNVTSRENDVFDFLMERLIPPPTPGDRMLGQGAAGLSNMVTLQLDDGPSLARLRAAGFPIAAPARRICHWSPYLRPGVFPLYRAVLCGALPPARLRALLPQEHAPRWSRLAPRLPGARPGRLAAG